MSEWPISEEGRLKVNTQYTIFDPCSRPYLWAANDNSWRHSMFIMRKKKRASSLSEKNTPALMDNTGLWQLKKRNMTVSCEKRFKRIRGPSSVKCVSSAHLVSKEAVDEVNLVPWLAWFGGDPEIEVANSCIQLLLKSQVLGKQMASCVSLQLSAKTQHVCLTVKHADFQNMPKSCCWFCACHYTCVMDHFTMTFLAKTLNMVARYLT